METASRISPGAISTSNPSTLARLAVGRSSTLTLKPRASALRATAAPTKPEAPVTKTVSTIGGSGLGRSQGGASFDTLPIQQRRNTDHDLTRPLEQGHRQTH